MTPPPCDVTCGFSTSMASIALPAQIEPKRAPDLRLPGISADRDQTNGTCPPPHVSCLAMSIMPSTNNTAGHFRISASGCAISRLCDTNLGRLPSGGRPHCMKKARDGPSTHDRAATHQHIGHPSHIAQRRRILRQHGTYGVNRSAVRTRA